MEKVLREIGLRDTILGGDFNAWNIWWGSRETDDRGEELHGWFEERGLQILNRGTEPTFHTIRGGRTFSSRVDITVCTTDILGRIEGWKVDDSVTSSDHRAILFNIRHQKSKLIEIARTTRLYNTKKANWGQFREKLAELCTVENINEAEIEKIETSEDLDRIVEKYTEVITQSSKFSIPEIKKHTKTRLPWWTDKLDEMKKEVTRRKRRIRNAASIRREWVVEQYTSAKAEYLLEISRAQTASWKEFCTRQDRESMWDSIYRVIGRTTDRQEDLPLVVGGEILGAVESAEMLAGTFYPEDNQEDDNADHMAEREVANTVNRREHDESCDPPFSAEELKWSASSFNPRKAPGQDGLTADICCAAIALNPALVLSIANRCLSLSHFPTKWKEAVVVVLRKPGKSDYTLPKSYRPIGLLPVLGKIVEKMLIRRIRWHTLPTLSTRQYGFTPQRSTEDSLYVLMRYIRQKLDAKKLMVVVSLDIEGAFDSAWWPAIKCRLAESGCPSNLRRMVDSYLEDRCVRLRYAGAECRRVTTKGCVQGSIGGPTFWNLLLDPLLKELEGGDLRGQAFADDVVLVISGDNGQEVSERANAVLDRVRRWGVKNKLKFAPHKTSAMVVTRKLKFDSPRLAMGGVRIGLSKEIKLLGLTIDNGLTFNTHVLNVCRKALGLYCQLSRAAKIQWGLSPEVIRTIYVSVVEPVIMYAASAWAPAASKLGVRKQFDTVQRGFAQKLVKAYRTVSLNSALLLAGLLPLDLRIQEAAALYEVKRGYSQRVVGDRGVEVPVPVVSAPHPVDQVGYSFECVVDGAALVQNDSSVCNIFTDGSKLDGKVGAALSLWRDNAEATSRKFKLESFCTVYQDSLSKWIFDKQLRTKFLKYSTKVIKLVNLPPGLWGGEGAIPPTLLRTARGVTRCAVAGPGDTPVSVVRDPSGRGSTACHASLLEAILATIVTRTLRSPAHAEHEARVWRCPPTGRRTTPGPHIGPWIVRRPNKVGGMSGLVYCLTLLYSFIYYLIVFNNLYIFLSNQPLSMILFLFYSFFIMLRICEIGDRLVVMVYFLINATLK
ncbi:hypothetical protein ABMA28_011383 [Loxostege sticticalis]|uniref:Reverse transcriptase domain-containing protein n=1 Tax=Loxostege sticticalis TaxID=481309 RepID=A0ABD0S4Z4_LOXSC